jgi:type 1 fimbria pilin
LGHVKKAPSVARFIDIARIAFIMNSFTVSSKRCARIATSFFLLLTVALFSKGILAQTCGSSDYTLGVGNVGYSGGADKIGPGMQIGSGWAGSVGQTPQLVFCNPAQINRTTAEPIDTPIPGLIYLADGLSFPIYPTGVDGIGYVVGIKDVSGSQYYPLQGPFVQVFPGIGTPGGVWAGFSFSIRILFVATGRLTTGSYPVPGRAVARLRGYVDMQEVTPSPSTVITGANVITLSAIGCQVTSPDQQSVRLPVVSPSAFSGVGSAPAARSAPFVVSVSCDPGVNVYATMTDVTAPGNVSDTLTPSAGSTAAGVGVQVFRDGLVAPVAFGPDSSAPGTTNQWFVGSSAAAQSYNIPFTAGYVQTDNNVAPGLIQSRASITFSYQ